MRVLSAVLALLLVCTAVTFGQTSTEPQQPSANSAPQAPPSDQKLDTDKAVPQRVRVSQGVSQGLLIHKVNPVYPAKARSKGIQGAVRLEALIGKDGLVKDVKQVSGPEELAPAAIDAVRQWQFQPYFLKGEPVEVETSINVVFTLRR
jgi:TonB family protein